MNHISNDLFPVATVALLFCSSVACAEVHSLQPGGGPPTQIQDAIDLAQHGDTIELSSGYWTYGQDYLPFDLDGKRLAIKGEENGWVVLGTDGKERFEYIITIDDAISKGTLIKNIWFTGNGSDTGGVISINQSNVAVDQCVFLGLKSLYEDGITAIDSTLSMTRSYAISNSLLWGDIINCSNCTLTVDQCNFIDYNQLLQPPRNGGGIYASGGEVRITNTVFDRAGGRASVGLPILASSGLIENCDFLDTCGGVTVGSSTDRETLMIKNCRFERSTPAPNTSSAGRGVLAYGPVIITESTFTGPQNGAYGGGIELKSGGVVAACTISDCTQYLSGGGATTTGFSIFWGCDFINNTAETKGGGLNLSSWSGRSLILDCLFEGNSAPNGGGVATRSITGDLPVQFHGCNFTNNEAEEEGGAIAALQFGGPVDFMGCGFKGNVSGAGSSSTAYASDYGGHERPILSFQDCTYVKSPSPPSYTVDLGGNLTDIRFPGDDSGIMLYSGTGNFEAPGLTYKPTDKHSVYAYDRLTGQSELYFDGWWMLQNDTIDAVARLDRDELIMSLKGSGTTTPPSSNQTGQAYDGEDLLAFTGTKFGSGTTGEWRLYFDGSDVGIPSGTAGDIDALAIEDDGDLLMSFSGRFDHPEMGQIEDDSVVRFIPTQLGEHTSGTWEYLFDSTYSGLSAPGEDIDALTIQQQWPEFTDFFLSTTGNCTIPDVTASNEDIIEMMWFSGFSSVPAGWTRLWADGLSDMGFSSAQANLTGLHWAPIW